MKGSAKHGHSRTGRITKVYRIYGGMIARCTNPKQPNWKDYGGRGIRVCSRWRGPKGFQNFLRDMGEPPAGLTLDRINNEGDYEPSNCRWATYETQHRNSRHSRKATYQGETLCMTDWSKRLGINLNTLNKRLNGGWPVEIAFTTPVNRKLSRAKGSAHVSG